MVGYPESLTDPSYRGQILVLTYPLVGNYGVFSEDDKDLNGLPLFFESAKIHITALVVGTYHGDYSHWRAIKSLSTWLKEHNVPAIHGVDTRALTKKIRTKGVMLAKLRVLADPKVELLQWSDPNKRNLVSEGPSVSLLPLSPSPLSLSLNRAKRGGGNLWLGMHTKTISLIFVISSLDKDRQGVQAHPRQGCRSFRNSA